MRVKFTENCKIAITKLKSETVLVIASILAIVSMFFNPPGREYVDFIDFRVLGILLSLMLVMAGFQINGVFSRLGGKLISGCNSTRKLAVTLIFLCFLSSMLLTNDVALITFVPFALLTFIAFFIFIGNMGQIEAVRKLLSSLIEGRELLVSVVSSQVVSNVPAAILLSGFTDNYSALIVGTNLGGLGTLIASMASLISYKQFVNAYPQKKGKYFAEFTIMNIVFLVILALAVYIFGY